MTALPCTDDRFLSPVTTGVDGSIISRDSRTGRFFVRATPEDDPRGLGAGEGVEMPFIRIPRAACGLRFVDDRQGLRQELVRLFDQINSDKLTRTHMHVHGGHHGCVCRSPLGGATCCKPGKPRM